MIAELAGGETGRAANRSAESARNFSLYVQSCMIYEIGLVAYPAPSLAGKVLKTRRRIRNSEVITGG
jgi:hypothetical protein